MTFILVIVADDMPQGRRKAEVERARELLKSSALPIELRVFDFGELKKKYGVTTGDT